MRRQSANVSRQHQAPRGWQPLMRMMAHSWSFPGQGRLPRVPSREEPASSLVSASSHWPPFSRTEAPPPILTPAPSRDKSHQQRQGSTETPRTLRSSELRWAFIILLCVSYRSLWRASKGGSKRQLQDKRPTSLTSHTQLSLPDPGAQERKCSWTRRSQRMLPESPILFCVAQACLTLGNPMDCSPPGSSVHELSQARILEWGATPFSRASSPSRDWTQVSCTAGRFFAVWILQRVTAIFSHSRGHITHMYRASLVVQWWRTCWAMQWTQFRSPVREDFTCCAEASPCSATTEATRLEPTLSSKGEATARRSPHNAMQRRPRSPQRGKGQYSSGDPAKPQLNK